MLFWSGNFIIGRFFHADIQPLQLAFFRWLGAALIVSPVLIKNFKNIYKTFKKHYIILNILSILGITAFNTLLYIGLQDTTATNALIINSSIPVLILFFSFLILKIPINTKQLIGILFSSIVVIYLILRGELSNLLTLSFNHGDLWVVSSSVIWALYSVSIKFKPKNLSDFEFFTTIVYIGLFWLFIIYKLMGYSFIADLSITQKYYPVFIYVSLFTSVLSFYFWHKGIHEIGANKTGQFTHLMPLFGAILAYIFLGERLHLFHIIGAIFIGFGIYLSLFSKKVE